MRTKCTWSARSFISYKHSTMWQLLLSILSGSSTMLARFSWLIARISRTQDKVERILRRKCTSNESRNNRRRNSHCDQVWSRSIRIRRKTWLRNSNQWLKRTTKRRNSNLGLFRRRKSDKKSIFPMKSSNKFVRKLSSAYLICFARMLRSECYKRRFLAKNRSHFVRKTKIGIRKCLVKCTARPRNLPRRKRN